MWARRAWPTRFCGKSKATAILGLDSTIGPPGLKELPTALQRQCIFFGKNKQLLLKQQPSEIRNLSTSLSKRSLLIKHTKCISRLSDKNYISLKPHYWCDKKILIFAVFVKICRRNYLCSPWEGNLSRFFA